MRGLKQCLMIAAIVLPTMAVAADTVTMTAGRWEVTMRMLKGQIGEMPLPPEAVGKPSVDHSCISAAEGANPQAYFLSTQKDDSCKSVGTVAGGKLAITADCVSNDTVGKMVLNGTYSSHAYDVEVNAAGTTSGANFTSTSRITARHVGTCRGDED